ncbi:MAG: glycosyltransferase family 4 protein [Deltaproteobacteria bacterium]|nr:glycosyltransferase family 4 protein [Deltaproteobacteria bacterium]MBW2071178.1 glycosyltransferase family 4 protein [Deltaproteobacteria bacterium]
MAELLLRVLAEMNIGISIEHLHGKKTGVGQYGFHIALSLARIDPQNHYSLFSPSPLSAPDAKRLTAQPNLQLFDHNPLARIFSSDVILIPLWLQFYLPYITRRHRLDIYFHTGSIWPLLPFRAARRRFVFIHDVIPLLFPECYYKHSVLYYRLTRMTNVKTYDGFIVNSETTKKDLQLQLGIRGSRICVTALGKDDRFVPVSDSFRRATVRAKYTLPEFYILSVGTLEPRKNIVGLLKAFARAKSRQILKLVIIGKTGWLYSDIFETVKQLGIGNEVMFTGFVDDDDLPAIYSMARAFVYPSLYEGFGLPVLEAMACGVPVITSDIPAIEEIVGDAAIRVNPNDIVLLAKSIDEVALEEATHHRLRQAALSRAHKFTWENTARQTLEFFLSSREAAHF